MPKKSDIRTAIPHPKRGQHIKHTSNMMKRVNAGHKYITGRNVARGTGKPKTPRAY
jgi:hypothetical protein